MSNLFKLIGWLSLITFGIILFGYFVLEWKLTLVLPFAIGSLILFIQWLATFNIQHKNSRFLSSLAFVFQLILVLLFVLDFIEIAVCWKWMFTLLTLSIVTFLHDIILRLTASTKNQILRIASTVLAFLSFLLCSLYIHTLVISKIAFFISFCYLLFVGVNIWVSKETDSGSKTKMN